jgi:hypothetical protein
MMTVQFFGMKIRRYMDARARDRRSANSRCRGANPVEGSFEVFSPMIERGPSPATLASRAAFEMACIAPDDVDVAQLQDTESGAEILHMAENGLCANGEQEQWLARGLTPIGGRLPVNRDGAHAQRLPSR